MDLSTIEVGTQVQFLKRQGDGVALAFQASYEQAVIQGNADQISFGLIVEVVKGPVSLTLDPLFTKKRGDFADQEGLGLQYGWPLKYELKLGLADVTSDVAFELNAQLDF